MMPAALVPRTLARAVELWWASYRSPLTRRDYGRLLLEFQQALATVGLALDSDVAAVADILQVWSQRTSSRTPPRVATVAKRQAVISSFYRFAIQRRYVDANPADLIQRQYAPQFAASRAIAATQVAAQLAAIDTATVVGRRDRALLAVALTTGRRVAELAALRWGAIEIDDGAVVLTFRAKGDKEMRDRLAPSVTALLLAAIRDVLPDLAAPPDAPIWYSFRHHQPPAPLTVGGIRHICWQRLGTRQVHALRHTFARSMAQAGATMPELAARLGHANVATTSRYVTELLRDENPLAATLADLFGLQ